jgi:hypothetical protein
MPALEAKKLLIEGTGTADVFVLYITKSSARTGIEARCDDIFFFLMGAYSLALCNCASNAGRRRN